MNPLARPVRPATWLALGLAAAGLAAGAVAIGLAVRPSTGGEPLAANPPAPSSTPSAEPSAQPPAQPPLPDVPVQDADLSAAVPTVAPVALSLPSLGVQVPVDPVGVADDGQMEIPPHAERAGWYRYGPTPGADRGTAVIAAHVDSIVSEGLGPFAALGDLQPGDEADVSMADGTVVTFAVQQVTSVPKTDVTWPDVFERDGPSRLVLVTCGGTWDPDVRHYSNNVIVALTPVGPGGSE